MKARWLIRLERELWIEKTAPSRQAAKIAAERRHSRNAHWRMYYGLLRKGWNRRAARKMRIHARLRAGLSKQTSPNLNRP